jgi:hypothetical protein
MMPISAKSRAVNLFCGFIDKLEFVSI